jgi:hypothetical protein
LLDRAQPGTPLYNNMKDNTLLTYLESAHDNLVQAAKIAHLEHHKDAEGLSKLIDQLEELFEQFNS